jgi:hypothetical protein
LEHTARIVTSPVAILRRFLGRSPSTSSVMHNFFANVVPLKRILLLLTATLLPLCAVAKIDMNRDGCGETKGCLFKPAGCIPSLDCTIGIIFFVSGPNRLTVQLVATSLLPAPPLQYIAVGFSHDAEMGDDYVMECVLSPTASEFGVVEVFSSYNRGKLNDRTYLNSTEQLILFDGVEGEVVDNRLTCQFVQQIVPQMSSKSGRLWNLNHKYFIIGATGSAQPDEVNAHDTSLGSHFYPIVSARPINPSVIGERLYDLPPPFAEPVEPTAVMMEVANRTVNKTVTMEPTESATEPSSRESAATAWRTMSLMGSLLAVLSAYLTARYLM